MDQRIFLLILIIFLLSSNFSKVFEDIINSFFYLILILSIIKIINPSIQKKILSNMIIFINTDNYSIKNITSKFASYVKISIFGKNTSQDQDSSQASNSSGSHPPSSQASNSSGSHPSSSQASNSSGSHPPSSQASNSSGSHPPSSQASNSSGSHPSGSHPSGSHPSGSQASSSHPSGSHRAGSHRSGSHRAGSHPTWFHVSGSQPTNLSQGSFKPIKILLNNLANLVLNTSNN